MREDSERYLINGGNIWRRNADIADRRVTDQVASIVRRGSTSIATTRNIASGAGRVLTARGAFIRRRASIVTDRVRTSASGAARSPTAAAAFTVPPANTRSEAMDINNFNNVDEEGSCRWR